MEDGFDWEGSISSGSGRRVLVTVLETAVFHERTVLPPARVGMSQTLQSDVIPVLKYPLSYPRDTVFVKYSLSHPRDDVFMKHPPYNPRDAVLVKLNPLWKMKEMNKQKTR